MNNKVCIEAEYGEKFKSGTYSDLKVIFELFEYFMPKSIAVDNRKDMAMYEAFHRLKNLITSFIPTTNFKIPENLQKIEESNWDEILKEFEEGNNKHPFKLHYTSFLNWLKENYLSPKKK